MPEYLSFVYAVLAIYLVSAGRRLGFLSPLSVFVYTQSIMTIGILPGLERTIAADRIHAALLLVTLGVVVGVGIFGSFVGSSTRKRYEPQVDYRYPRSVWVWVIISLGVCVLYYASIGYISFFESIDSIINGGSEDIAGSRLEAYAGTRYLFPGYVNQFKNALLPALVFVILAASFRDRKRSRWFTVAILVPATLIFLLGTGQRSPLVRVLVFLAVVLYLVAPRRAGRYLPRIVLVGVPIFFVATFATGRATSSLQAAEGLWGQIGVLFEQLVYRIFGSSQTASIAAFRYVDGLDRANGADWAQSLMGLLPGQPGSTVSNEVFAILYGSTRGNAPPSLWGSAYYNFGFVGTLVVAGIIAIVLCVLSLAANRINRTNLVQLSGVAGVTMTFGLWISESPVTVLNGGLAIYLLLWGWGTSIDRRRAREISVLTPDHAAFTRR